MIQVDISVLVWTFSSKNLSKISHSSESSAWLPTYWVQTSEILHSKGSFLNIGTTPLFWSEITKVTNQYKLPHYNDLYTTDTEWAPCRYNHYREIESESKTPSRESNLRPCAPQARFDAALASSNSSGLILPASGAQVQWLSSRTYVQVVTVAFWCLEVFQTAPCTSYPSKQQRPTAWFTALRYQCPLLKGILSYSVSQQSMIWVLKKYFILTLTRRELKNWILKNLRASGETKSSFTADR